MECFAYPLDTKTLLRKKRSIRKELSEQTGNWTEKRIAVLGGSTTNEVVDQLELFLLAQGIRPTFYQSEYAKYYEDAMFGNVALDAFHPDVIYVHTNWRNIQAFPEAYMQESETDKLLEAEFGRWEGMWQRLRERYGCPILQNNFDRPGFRLLGNRDIWDARGRSGFVAKLNQRLYAYARRTEAFYVNDIDYLAAEYGLTAWNDPVYWNLYKYFCPLGAIPHLAQSVSNLIKSLFGKNKKLLALDLDNTLWGGVIGDDGVEGIKIGPELPGGQIYHEFQEYVKALKENGVLLAVDSKNELENALAGLAHPSGLLRKDDFVAIKANWEPKDENLRRMAQELSLGLDSFVFVDDNPAEQDIVRMNLPMVETPAVKGVEDFVKILDHEGYFEATVVSAEDRRKTESYQARAAAIADMAKYQDYDSYLKSLQMQAYVQEFEDLYVQRVAQLTNKSNQFNLTTLRCTEEDIRRMQESADWICLCAGLKDRFADNGIVSVVAGEILGDTLHVRLWLMSCRVLKRGLEDLMMNCLVKRAAERGVKKIIGYYIPTAKNGMVKDFYAGYGFVPRGEADSKSGAWCHELNPETFQMRKPWITLS